MPPNKVVRKAAAARTPGTKAKQNFAEDDIFMMISFVSSCGSSRFMLQGIPIVERDITCERKNNANSHLDT